MAHEYSVNQTDLIAVADAIRTKGETSEALVFPDGFVTAIENISGGGLNFSIVGGTTEPANPTENTIWVNTDTEITSWVFSTTEPDNTEAGMVWISTSVSSCVEFNALKKNGITVYPINVNQYISGTWVDKTAKSYQSGEWVEWARYLYDKGDECTDITGGWKNINGMEYNGYKSDGAYTNDGDTYKLSVSVVASHIARITNNKIDLTNVKKISVYALDSNDGRLVISTNNTKLSSDANAIVAEIEVESGICSIDVSEISGSYYIATRIMNTAEETGSKIMTVSQIWME